MAANDRIILDEILSQRQAEIDPGMPAHAFFELFSSEQILKDFDLSYDEIVSGLVGDGGDGGVDAIYTFVNGEVVQEDPEFEHLKKNIIVDVVIIQSKVTPGFQETPVERLITVTDDIFDLSKNPDSFASVYNENLIEGMQRFRAVQKQLAAKFPTMRVSYFYASKGDAADPNVKRKVEKLQAILGKHFPSAAFSFKFLGSGELLALARRAPQTSYTLPLAENPISSEGQVGFVCLVAVKDYSSFICDEKGVLRRQLFDANVRDYQGRTEVNDDIQQTLEQPQLEDFWWLNNGISILATKASQSGKALHIENPQIVNGLQTSTEIYNYFAKANTINERRKVLVRVIVPIDDASGDRIIKATNSQTNVQQASLRATDKIHRDIEALFRPRGLFYDRRKNFYKNEGKPRAKIIGIPHLAQAVMSILLRRPDTARARPASLLKNDDDYRKVYSESHPILMYYACAAFIQRVEELLAAAKLTAKDQNNLKFYVAMHAMSQQVKKQRPGSGDIAKLEPSKIEDQVILDSLKVILPLYTALGANDQAAKGTNLKVKVEETLSGLKP